MEKPVGYVAFDAANLIPCLAVVRQLASRLESIRLYQEAADGRRLAEEANRFKEPLSQRSVMNFARRST